MRRLGDAVRRRQGAGVYGIAARESGPLRPFGRRRPESHHIVVEFPHTDSDQLGENSGQWGLTTPLTEK
jgi:hypothetical protein